MASITCRNGETFPAKHTHNSVAEVRACQGAPSDWKPAPATSPVAEGIKAWGVTGAQAMANAENLTKTLAPILGSLSVKPTGTSAGFRVDPELEAKVPDGRYAIEQDGAVKFYRVRKVTRGQWAGRTFVDRQAGDESFPVRFAGERAKILREIAADVKAAAIRYGRELGQCSQCGRTLTNPESIALGIGPICLNKVS